MNVSVEKISSNKVKLSYEVEAARFDEAVNRAYYKVRGRVSIPGFRKGKAPRKLIENYYGEGFLYNEAFDILFDEIYGPSLDENHVEVVDRPEIDIQQIGAGQDLKFTCEVYVMPAVTLGEYTGVEVQKEHTLVTEDEVDARIESERKKQAAEVKVEDRPVQDGDIVELDYAGTMDGVPFAGGTAEHQKLTIGSHAFIPGFEEQMVGMTAGEEKDLTVTFPEDYGAEDLAGKEAVFHVKVHEIRKEELPELDDEFVKDISEFETMDEYRADVRAKLEQQAAERDENSFKNAVVDKVIELAEVDIPKAMVDRQIDSMMQDFSYRLRAQGMRMEDFMHYTGQDEAAMREDYRPQAEKSVRAHLVLSAIEKAENIEATEEEVDAEIAKFAPQTGKTPEELKATFTDSDREYFRADAIRDKAIRFLTENAVAGE